jgi:adenine-specific DNA-methyltransferase
MTTGHEIASEWSDRFGLALAPLFESHDADALPGQHHVLLDGGLGTFALSTSSEDFGAEMNRRGGRGLGIFLIM